MQADLPSLFARAAQVAADYRLRVGDLPVQPSTGRVELDKAFGGSLPRDPTPAPRSSSGSSRPPNRAWSQQWALGTSGSSSAARLRPPRPPTCWPSDGTSAPTTRCSHLLRRPRSGAAGARLKELLHLPASASTGSSPGHGGQHRWARHRPQQAAGRRRVGRPPRRAGRRASGSRRHERGATRDHRPSGSAARTGDRDIEPVGTVPPTEPSTPTTCVWCSSRGDGGPRSPASSSATSTRARATTCAPRSRSPTNAARGSTSTAPLASGPRRAHATPISSMVSSSRTRGGPMPTNGSTCRTTAASRSAPTPAFTRPRCRTVRHTSVGPERPPTSSSVTSRPSRAAGQEDSRSGPLSRSSACRRGRPRRAVLCPCRADGRPLAPGERRSSTTSCSTRSSSLSATTSRRTRSSTGSNARGSAGSAARRGGPAAHPRVGVQRNDD